MIVRVKKIIQVGKFRDFKNGASVPFSGGKKITLVHGMNTLGKTTFTHILKSLNSGDNSHIQKRKTIPPIPGLVQKIEISYENDAGDETVLQYSGGSWQPNDLSGKILIFDQDFINTHVMTGDLISRDNKEQFTDFVLGSEGVKLSSKIESDKKTIRTRKQTLPTLRPKHVRGALSEKEVENFAKLEVKEDTPTLDKELETPTKRLKRLEGVKEFQQMRVPEVEFASEEAGFQKISTEHSVILAESYESVSEETWEVLQGHIQENCEGEHAVGWLKTGLEIQKDPNTCPNCGQGVEGVKKLFDAYREIFDEKFEEYETGVIRRISQLTTDINLATADSLVVPVNRFLKKVEDFQPYIQSLDERVSHIESELKLLEELDQKYKISLVDWGRDVQEELERKSKSIYRSLKSNIHNEGILEQAKNVAEQQVIVRELQSELVEHIKNAQEQVSKFTPAQIQSNIATARVQIEEINRKKARIEQDAECALYLKEVSEIEAMKKQTEEDVRTLEVEQSEYLEEYFGSLDAWFKRLGSDSGFEIYKDSKKTGDKKVYSLSVKYHGQKISPEDFGKVFSESDKRNLALAVFLSRAEKLEPKSNYILVFDDPVVSFDDNRRRRTCIELKGLALKYRQVIVLSHYSSMVKDFVNYRVPACYLQICEESGQSCLKVLKPEDYAKNPHIRAADEILYFIDGGTEIGTRDLRPFMEEHLKLRFQRQISKHTISDEGLEKLINNLGANSIISNEAVTELHGYREALNPDMHQSGGVINYVELRNDAKAMMDFVYEL